MTDNRGGSRELSFALFVILQVVYHESDSEAEVELVDAAAGDDTDGDDEDEYYTDDEEGSEEGDESDEADSDGE